MHQKDLMRHFLLCIKSKNRMQHVPEHTYMIKKNVWKHIRKQLYALIFKKQRDSINISSSSSVYFPFRRPFSKPNSPGFKIRLVSDVIAWGESLRHTRRGNPPSKTWDLPLRVTLFPRGRNTPWKINGWNLQITHLERNMIFQTSIIMVHVNLPGVYNWCVWCVLPIKAVFLPHCGQNVLYRFQWGTPWGNME